MRNHFASPVENQLIIISQGHNGLKYSLKAHDGTFGEWVHLKPCQIDNIVDTSGAGDWLAASFLWYFLRMFPKAQDYLPPDIIKQLLIDSQIIAAYSCLYLGAQGILLESGEMGHSESGENGQF